MRRDLLGNLQTAAIPEVGCDSCRPERVVSNFRRDAAALCLPPNHPIGISLAQRSSCERIESTDRDVERNRLPVVSAACRPRSAGSAELHGPTRPKPVRDPGVLSARRF
jgi:hypothetical protein